MVIFLKNKKMLLILSSVLIIGIIGIFIFALLNRTESEILEQDNNINIEKLENEFNEILKNEENEYVKTRYTVLDEKAGTYSINATFPYLDIDTEQAKQINKEIDEIFLNKILQIGNEGNVYSIFEMDYSTQANEDILSLIIKCVIKEGRNPKRVIIKTYNYNLKNNKKVWLTELISEDNKKIIQEKIYNKIKQEIKKEEGIIKQGYNTFRRDINSDIYNLNEKTDFYLDENKILYIIYSYGNNNYTSQVDLIIDKIK